MTAKPIDWTKVTLPDANVRNESGKSVEEVLATLKAGGVEIRYGDIFLLAEARMLDEARAYVRELSQKDRQAEMQSLDSSLRRLVKKVIKGTASKRIMDELHTDLLLWTALKEVSAS